MPFGRKRGAQPKNRNALKHGWYSGAMTKAVAKIFRQALTIDDASLTNEIALLRTTLYRLAKIDPKNVEVLATVMRTLVRAVAVNHGLSKGQENEINDCMSNLIRDLLHQEQTADDGA